MSSIRRSVQVIDLLARRGPLGVRAVAQQLALPLGSVHRILVDLAAEAIVERTPSGEWELSYRLLTITGLQLDRLEFARLARPYCERIAEATRETVNVSAVSGMEVVLGVHCVGMPILDRAGHAVGGISITGPAPKVPGPALDELKRSSRPSCRLSGPDRRDRGTNAIDPLQTSRVFGPRPARVAGIGTDRCGKPEKDSSSVRSGRLA